MGALQCPPCRRAFGVREAEERRWHTQHRRHRQRWVGQSQKGAQHQHLTQDHVDGELCQQCADGRQLFGVVQRALSVEVAQG